jgi:hypothetical protein
LSFLTEELMALGHDVTLFASGDSVTSGRLAAMSPRALRHHPGVRDAMAPHLLMLEMAMHRTHAFDPSHFHLDYWSFSLSCRQATPFVTDLHLGRPARADAVGELSGDDLPPAARGSADAPAGRDRFLPRLPRPRRAGEAGGPGHRDRRPGEASAQDHGKVDRADRDYFEGGSARCSRSPTSR